MRTDRIIALARLANLKKEADLTRLAEISTRLQARMFLHDQTETALNRQADIARQSPEPPLWQVLDAHVILARQVLTFLAADIDRISAEREGQRQHCARSFGRAQVLDLMRDRLPARAYSR